MANETWLHQRGKEADCETGYLYLRKLTFLCQLSSFLISRLLAERCGVCMPYLQDSGHVGSADFAGAPTSVICVPFFQNSNDKRSCLKFHWTGSLHKCVGLPVIYQLPYVPINGTSALLSSSGSSPNDSLLTTSATSVPAVHLLFVCVHMTFLDTV